MCEKNDQTNFLNITIFNCS